MSYFGRRQTASTEQDAAVEEAKANSAAVTAVVKALVAARTSEEAMSTALDLVRERFGWAYGSYWRIDPAERALRFVQESGDAGPEFPRRDPGSLLPEGRRPRRTGLEEP